VKVKIGYQNFYLYSAIDSNIGNDFTLCMSHVNTETMNAWLTAFAEFLNDQKVILVMDGAGWHKSKDLIIPKNIRIVFLPPYSPQLNPVERLWNFIKDNTIKNRIYTSIEALYEAVSLFICNLKSETIASVCTVDYL
jgi:transposase